MLGKYLNFYYRPAWFDKEWWPRFGLSPQPSERCMKAIWMEDHDLIKLVHKYNCPWIMRREFNTFYQGPNTVRLVRLKTVRWHKYTEKNDQFLEELEESFGWKHTPQRSPRVDEPPEKDEADKEDDEIIVYGLRRRAAKNDFFGDKRNSGIIFEGRPTRYRGNNNDN